MAQHLQFQPKGLSRVLYHFDLLRYRFLMDSSQKLDLYTDLERRGILYQMTDPTLKSHINANKPITLYCGFDPTSDSLHVGSLLPILTLKRFQLAGHTPIFLLGGATGMIGDPSGKSSERNLQTPEQVAHNLNGIQKVASQFLDFSAALPNAAKIMNNADFYQGMDVLTFLREVGKHFTVNHMVAKDSVRSRMEDRDHGISYTEFSYMLLQGYDYYHLYQKYGCTLQIGASDQWGNITAGTDLIRKKTATTSADSASAPAAFGLTHPLITRSDGLKFGKSEKGAVWLSADKTSPYQFYQFFISSPDDRVIQWLKFLTFVSLEEIDAIEQELKTAPEKKTAQIKLAQELTRMVHGPEALARAEAATHALFGAEIKNLDLKTLQEVFADAPTLRKPKSTLEASGLALIDVLVESGLFQSKGAARKEIPAGGVYINNERVTDVAFTLNPSHLIAGAAIVIRKGKKNYQFLHFE